MKKIEKKYWIIISVIVIILCSCLIIYNINNNNRQNTVIENVLKDSFLLVEKLVFMPINFIDKKINQFSEFNKSEKKYQKLKNKNEQYILLQNRYNEVVSEINELKELMKLNTLDIDYIAINSTVINRNLGYWFDLIMIDKGSSDGIKVGDAVITTNGIIGEIDNTSYHNSTVKLLTNANKISVKMKLDDIELYGLLIGYNESNNTFLVEGISDNKEIPIGTSIVTAGLANNYPPGIIVGYVKNIVSDNFDLSRTLEVTPSANFNDIKYVEVLSKK